MLCRACGKVFPRTVFHECVEGRRRKLCRGCGKVLPPSAYHVSRKSASGRQARCRECQTWAMRAMRKVPAWRAIERERDREARRLRREAESKAF